MDDKLKKHIDSLLDNDEALFEDEEGELTNIDTEDEITALNSDEELDNSTESATIENSGVEKSEFDEFLDTLPTERERELAKEAYYNHKWDYKKYKMGGKSAEVWLATTPYIEAMKEYQQEIKELKKLVKSNTNFNVKGLKYQKAQAEEYLLAARDRLADAKEAGDVEAMETAYNEIKSIKKLLETTEEQLLEVSEQAQPQESPEYQAAYKKQMDEFIIDNWEWIHPQSPDYDKEKSLAAVNIEASIRAANPRIDPRILYKRVKIELSKLDSNNKSKESSNTKTYPGANRKQAVESVSSVRGSDYRATKVAMNDNHKLVAKVLDDLNRSGAGLMTGAEFQKKILSRK